MGFSPTELSSFADVGWAANYIAKLKAEETVNCT
jgi:hypothetical protein